MIAETTNSQDVFLLGVCVGSFHCLVRRTRPMHLYNMSSWEDLPPLLSKWRDLVWDNHIEGRLWLIQIKGGTGCSPARCSKTSAVYISSLPLCLGSNMCGGRSPSYDKSLWLTKSMNIPFESEKEMPGTFIVSRYRNLWTTCFSRVFLLSTDLT